jgi:hypothetical protein
VSTSDFAVMEIVSEAWRKTKGIKRYIIATMLVMYGATFLVMTSTGTLGALVLGGEGFGSTMLLELLGQIVALAVTIPFAGGMFIMGLRHIQGKPVEFGQMFAAFSKLVPLWVAGMLTTLMTTLGLIWTVPMLFLAIAILYRQIFGIAQY